MTLYRIYAKKIASRRYQVMFCTAFLRSKTDSGYTAKAFYGGIALLSPFYYQPGYLINPTFIIRELIAAKGKA